MKAPTSADRKFLLEEWILGAASGIEAQALRGNAVRLAEALKVHRILAAGESGGASYGLGLLAFLAARVAAARLARSRFLAS